MNDRTAQKVLPFDPVLTPVDFSINSSQSEVVGLALDS
jgi:hypothetical protein